MTRPLLLDLFCGDGGAAKGYHDAGFDVVGVDIAPHPLYPFDFVQMDAFEYMANTDLSRFAAFHGSPPCQAFCVLRHLTKGVYPELVSETREAFELTGKPYVIENVIGAPLRNTVTLCGTMFRLKTECGAELRRHRKFETNWTVWSVPYCRHGQSRRKGLTTVANRVISITGNTPQRQIVRNVTRETFTVNAARIAMGIDWMTMKGLSQAIPPAYTKFIGDQLMREVRG